jgi:hypothetical protein
MPTLTVSTGTRERITDLARAWDTTEDGAVVRLLDFWKGAGATPHEPGTPVYEEEDQIPIHVVYYGHRADGVYHPSTKLIDIISGPGSKATGLKPSRAAGEVIKAANELRGVTGTGSRNGWSFWLVDATGEFLQSMRNKPLLGRSS